MKIVILDKNTTTSNNDINFSKFNDFGEVHIYENLTTPEQVIDACQNANIIILNKIQMNNELITKLPASVKMIAITATGYDNVDISSAKEKGILVCNTPGYGTNAVAQLTMQMMLSLSFNIKRQIMHMNTNGWDKKVALALPMQELYGKTIGIVGLGTIGQEVAKMARIFGMKVIGFNRTPKNIDDIDQVSLKEIASKSDFVSLNLALNENTRQIINKNFISLMKPSSFLINTARGGIIDEAALIDALKNNKIAGAGLDVLTQEPPALDNPLLNMDNVIITPHIAWAPVETRQRCIDIVYDNIAKFIAGTPQFIINS
ncbi:MAG: D-2-hydroxyacid dehydrogenase [Burkholderiales bacterium]|nr:D-2-hydroxyacid dehydrogenase [Burkholderiales bacterium]